MQFENSINYLISDLSTVHRAELEASLTEVGLHSGQVFILFELWEQDGLNQTDLAKNLNLAAPTINKMVKVLSRSGFVVFKRSDTDGRVVNVFLTDKGKHIKPMVQDIWRNLELKITTPLTETEKLMLVQLLEKILYYFYNEAGNE